jgi:hypothetical protein
LIALICLFVICLYGITFGNEKVQKWVTSFIVSVLSSVLITSPIQLSLTAVFMATVFKNRTDVFQDKNHEDMAIDISATAESQAEAVYFGIDLSVGASPISDHIRKKRLIEKRIKDILKKILIQALFLTFLFITACSVRDSNSYIYRASLNNQFTSIVTGYQMV